MSDQQPEPVRVMRPDRADVDPTSNGAPGQPESFQLNKDGTVRAIIGDRVHRLRRPKIGEFRRLREHQQEINDELSERSLAAQQRAREMNDELKAAEGDADALRRLRTEDRALSREIRERAEQLRIDWVRHVFELLADRPLPEDPDDWESYLLDPNLPADLVTHWQTRPLRSGGR